MAAPKFNDLNGVVLIETISRSGVTKKVGKTRFAYADNDYSYKVDSTGDTMFMLDPEHNYDIVELIVKCLTIYVDGHTYIRACKASDAEAMKDYIPYHYGPKKHDPKFDPYIIYMEVRGSRSHSGVYFTSREEAEKWQGKLRNNECFVSLKKGDKVYVVAGGKVHELDVNDIELVRDEHSNYYGGYKFFINIKGGNSIKLNNTRFEDRASELLDCGFYAYIMNVDGEEFYSKSIRVFMKKSDAEKAVAETSKRKQKSATVKYIKKMENHDGKSIAHQDNLGNELHYGDTVAYIRRTGYNGHPEVRQGVVVGESKTKITVFDSDEKENGKPTGWRGERKEETDGKHAVEPQSVLLMKLAEVNKTSSYTFVKAK